MVYPRQGIDDNLDTLLPSGRTVRQVINGDLADWHDVTVPDAQAIVGLAGVARRAWTRAQHLLLFRRGGDRVKDLYSQPDEPVDDTAEDEATDGE